MRSNFTRVSPTAALNGEQMLLQILMELVLGDRDGAGTLEIVPASAPHSERIHTSGADLDLDLPHNRWVGIALDPSLDRLSKFLTVARIAERCSVLHRVTVRSPHRSGGDRRCYLIQNIASRDLTAVGLLECYGEAPLCEDDLSPLSIEDHRSRKMAYLRLYVRFSLQLSAWFPKIRSESEQTELFALEEMRIWIVNDALEGQFGARIVQAGPSTMSCEVEGMVTEDEINAMPVQLDLGQVELSVQEFLSLRPGHQIVFEHPTVFSATLTVASAPWASCDVEFEEGMLKLTIKELLWRGNSADASAIKGVTNSASL